MSENIKKVCKHCGAELKKVVLPPDSDFNVEYLLVCMNDDCPYYVSGWAWMAEKFNQKVSYRYKYDPFTNVEGPLPALTPEMWKDMVESN